MHVARSVAHTETNKGSERLLLTKDEFDAFLARSIQVHGSLGYVAANAA